MKSKKNHPTIMLPECACDTAGFTDKDPLELYVAEGVIVFLKNKMTALEVANTIESLSSLASDLTVTLAAACGICDNCGDENETNPADWVSNCSLCHDLLDESQNIRIPDYIMEEAGIPAGARLEAFADEESGEIIVAEAEIQQDIKDVPTGILSMLAASGVCLAELDELIMLDRIICSK
ncbi:hypothetical protein [Erysipelothrix anatis]|uniref:hypothetical protein n=1 Tax=Erysipelothrix anatis TaxID=2683713 RepID=UPI00140C6913|nr:hypothetical protein [Erysipelothrix anatis]